MRKIFIIAGEKSGDNLGGKLITQIKEIEPDADIKGIGGLRMEQAGLGMLFNMKEINLMGFLEVLPHIFRLKKLIKQTVDAIIKFSPDILVTIDSPGFNFRVVKELRKRNFQTRYIHYVAPSVWAYKPERAKKTADLYDLLISIIPWEMPYFEREGLLTEYFGHPLFEDLHILNYDEKIKYRAELGFNNKTKIISILAGSRQGEIKKHKDVLIETMQKLKSEYGDIKFYLLPTKESENFTKHELVTEELENDIIIISDDKEKQKIMQISDFSFVKSGTVALEVAALGAHHLIFYKINPISHWLIMRMVNITYANLINISANKEIIPELIQDKFTADNLVAIAKNYINNGYEKEHSLIEIELAKFKPSPETFASREIAETILDA